MQEYQEQGFEALPSEETFFQPKETPKDIARSLVSRTLVFVDHIETIIHNPLMINDSDYLDKLAKDIVSLHQLSLENTPYSSLISETRKLLNNILNCRILLPNSEKEVSCVEAAKDYRKSKRNKESLLKICKAYQNEVLRSEMLCQDLRLLAHDIQAEAENL